MYTSTILLVEDDPNSVFFFQRAATQVGITNPMHVAKDGREALDYLEGVGAFADRRTYPLPSLMILDLQLPRATGFEVLRHVRANPALRLLNVVMLTSSADEDDIAKAYALGANAYLVKPMGLKRLNEMVQSIRDFWLTQNNPPILGATDAEARTPVDRLACGG